MINKEEKNYLDLLKSILDNGSKKDDRTGVGTIGLFGTNLRFSLENNKVPMLTTKKMFLKGVIEELLFFLRGETDTKKLEAKGVSIWKGNTSREFLDKRGLKYLPEGNMGKGYGAQWRNWGGRVEVIQEGRDHGHTYDVRGIDQLAQVINTLKTNSNDRRMIISAWNPSQLHEMALPPCHIFAQFYVDNGKLSSQFYMRSVDTFLGLPFNLLSYAIMTHIIAKTVGMEAKELVFVGGDTHIYNNHIDQVNEQISRTPYEFPTIEINAELNSVKDIEALEYKNFSINNYECHPAIKAEMAI